MLIGNRERDPLFIEMNVHVIIIVWECGNLYNQASLSWDKIEKLSLNDQIFEKNILYRNGSIAKYK